ncbi:hypothetical protein MCEMIE11_00602 [Burkholderiales bacterium]
MQYNIMQYEEPSPEFELIDRKRVNVGGAEFDEAFLCDLLRDHFTKQAGGIRPTITTAYTIYLQESGAARRRKFSDDTTRYYNYFLARITRFPTYGFAQMSLVTERLGAASERYRSWEYPFRQRRFSMKTRNLCAANGLCPCMPSTTATAPAQQS